MNVIEYALVVVYYIGYSHHLLLLWTKTNINTYFFMNTL